jgi:hypothetical protein
VNPATPAAPTVAVQGALYVQAVGSQSWCKIAFILIVAFYLEEGIKTKSIFSMSSRSCALPKRVETLRGFFSRKKKEQKKKKHFKITKVTNYLKLSQLSAP